MNFMNVERISADLMSQFMVKWSLTDQVGRPQLNPIFLDITLGITHRA
jgi:hypothetical protein